MYLRPGVEWPALLRAKGVPESMSDCAWRDQGHILMGY